MEAAAADDESWLVIVLHQEDSPVSTQISFPSPSPSVRCILMLQGLRKEHIEARMQQAYAVTVISNKLVRCLRTEAISRGGAVSGKVAVGSDCCHGFGIPGGE